VIPPRPFTNLLELNRLSRIQFEFSGFHAIMDVRVHKLEVNNSFA